jgi:hypothetical protein
MELDNTRLIKVCILESLPVDDIKTGTDLYNSVLKYLKYSDSLNDAELFCIKTPDEFNKALDKIKTDIKTENIYPIIHIEAHGGDEFMDLSDGRVHWIDLYDSLIEINLLLKNMLIVILAMCDGGKIFKYFNPFKRSPFRILLSSPTEVFDLDIQKGFQEFYSTFFFSSQKSYSVDNLNQFIKNSESSFVLLDMEERFDYIVSLSDDPKYLKKNIASYKQIAIEHDKNFTKLSEEEQERRAKEWIKKYRQNIQSQKDYFMMRD